MNKHYTPKIEEFKVGFEYEYLDKFSSEKPYHWKNEVCNTDMLSIACDTFEHGTEYDGDDASSIFRVKYLDKQDVESCKFKLIDESDCYTFKNKKFLGMSPSDDNWIKLELDEDHNVYIIREYGRGNPDVLFDGIIKNLSELKMILDMLNIAYRNMG
jgi:hypothetical protein